MSKNELEAGLYDAEGNLICSWKESKIYENCKNAHFRIKNKYPTTKKVIIPKETSHIASYSFMYCTEIESVEILDGITSIEKNAFYKCTNLTNITIPESIEEIGNYLFLDCTGLNEIYYNGTKSQWDNIQKGINWNLNCPEDMQIIYRQVLYLSKRRKDKKIIIE